MEIPRGLYEVLFSEKLTIDQKEEAVSNFALPIHHLDGDDEGYVEAGAIHKEDAEMIIEALRGGSLKKDRNDHN